MADTNEERGLVVQASRSGALVKHGSASKMAAAAAAADRAAADTTFSRYLDDLTSSTIRAQHADLMRFGEYLIETGVTPDHLPDRIQRRPIFQSARLDDAKIARIEALAENQDDLYQLHTWAAQFASEPEAWAEVSFGIVAGFVQWMLQKGYAIDSVNRRLSTIKTFVQLAHDAGTIDSEKLAHIRTVRGYSGRRARNVNEKRAVTRVGDKKDTPRIIAVDEAVRLKGQPLDTHQGSRDAVMICLLLDLGLRVSEVVELTITSVDLERQLLKVYRRKTDVGNLLEMGGDLMVALSKYLEKRGMAEGPLLLRTRNNGQLAPGVGIGTRGIYKRVHYLGEQANIKPLAPHDGRHHWTSVAIAGGSDINSIMIAGGWKSAAMVLRYADKHAIGNKHIRLATKQAYANREDTAD